MSGGAGFPIKTFDNNYSKVVYFNGTDPNTATVFSSKNPVGVVDEPNLKNNKGYTYVGTDYKTWFSDGNSYSTYIYSGGGVTVKQPLYLQFNSIPLVQGDNVINISDTADLGNFTTGDKAISAEALANGVSVFINNGSGYYKNNTFKIYAVTDTSVNIYSPTVQTVMVTITCKLA